MGVRKRSDIGSAVLSHKVVSILKTHRREPLCRKEINTDFEETMEIYSENVLS